jgi:hypothetical protein
MPAAQPPRCRRRDLPACGQRERGSHHDGDDQLARPGVGEEDREDRGPAERGQPPRLDPTEQQPDGEDDAAADEPDEVRDEERREDPTGLSRPAWSHGRTGPKPPI